MESHDGIVDSFAVSYYTDSLFLLKRTELIEKLK